MVSNWYIYIFIHIYCYTCDMHVYVNKATTITTILLFEVFWLSWGWDQVHSGRTSTSWNRHHTSMIIHVVSRRVMLSEYVDGCFVQIFFVFCSSIT